MKDIEVMKAIQEQKADELSKTTPHELDDEGDAMADTKRFSFDIPVNVVTIDPLR